MGVLKTFVSRFWSFKLVSCWTDFRTFYTCELVLSACRLTSFCPRPLPRQLFSSRVLLCWMVPSLASCISLPVCCSQSLLCRREGLGVQSLVCSGPFPADVDLRRSLCPNILLLSIVIQSVASSPLLNKRPFVLGQRILCHGCRETFLWLWFDTLHHFRRYIPHCHRTSLMGSQRVSLNDEERALILFPIFHPWTDSCWGATFVLLRSVEAEFLLLSVISWLMYHSANNSQLWRVLFNLNA